MRLPMRCPSFSSIAIAAALTLATACDDPVAVAPELPSVDRGAGPSASEDPVGAALHQQVVGHALDYEEVGAQVSGELGPAEAHSQPLILIGTWCYRVFAQGGAGLEDLAIEVVDPNGVPLQRDSEVGPSA
ncbi:MAG: hypothetical protein H5U40_05810, partial [Polyangiaceae bacterium]|nr:hypothetical protein [Polyangiaceae bacterium]